MKQTGEACMEYILHIVTNEILVCMHILTPISREQIRNATPFKA